MIVLTPPHRRQIQRRVLSSILDAGLATVPFALNYFTRHPTFISGWLQISLPFAILAPARFLALTLLYPPPEEISWDREVLQIRWPDESATIPWSAFAGYRLTWDLPRRLKVYRTSPNDSVTIDLAAFDDQQRDALMAEIAMHSAALPNKRLKLTARVD